MMVFGRFSALLIFFTIAMILFSVTAGCEQDAPKDLIDEETYIEILVELHLLAGMKELDDNEKRFYAGQEAILSHYNITREQFRRSHGYYHQDMHEQQARYSEVRKRLDDLGSELTDRYQELRDKIKDDSDVTPDDPQVTPDDTQLIPESIDDPEMP